MQIVRVSNLKKVYSSKKNPVYALKGINFSVEQGEIFGILGSNGAGKSTTLNIIMGLLSPSEGEVQLFGDDFRRHESQAKQRMNIATAYADLASTVSVYRNLKVYALMYGVKSYETKIRSLLDKFGITHLANEKFGHLSAGEKTRVNLCKSFINDPELLLLDEPTASLDPLVAAQTRDLILEIQKHQRTTVLFTSHNMTEVEQLCDRVALLSKGEIYTIDTPQNLQKLIPIQLVTIFLGKHTADISETLNRAGYTSQYHKNYLEVQIPNQQEALGKLLDTLRELDAGVLDLTVEKPSLEQVFIKVAKGEI